MFHVYVRIDLGWWVSILEKKVFDVENQVAFYNLSRVYESWHISICVDSACYRTYWTHVYY